MREAPAPVPTTEPDPVNLEFVSGLACAELVGDIVHLVFYVDQVMPPELNCRRERKISRRLAISANAVDRMIGALQALRLPRATHAPPLQPM